MNLACGPAAFIISSFTWTGNMCREGCSSLWACWCVDREPSEVVNPHSLTSITDQSSNAPAHHNIMHS